LIKSQIIKDINKSLVSMRKALKYLGEAIDCYAICDATKLLFDSPEPSKAQTAPQKIAGRSADIRNIRTTYKQPRARMGYRRGQRN